MPGLKVNAGHGRTPSALRLRDRQTLAAGSVSGAQAPNHLDNKYDSK